MTQQQPEPVYYPVTKAELNQIKNDCAHPETDSCDGCEYAGDVDDTRASGIGCTFKGANILMDEVCARPPVKQNDLPQVISVEPHPPGRESLRCDNSCPARTPVCEEGCPLAEHDAAVAAKAKAEGAKEERERVLREKFIELGEKFLPYTDEKSPLYYCPMSIEGQLIRMAMEALRSSKQEREP